MSRRKFFLINGCLFTMAHASQAVDYLGDIMPIFEEKCFQCHSEKEGRVKGSLALDNLEDMESMYIGPYTTMRPGDPENSVLLDHVSDPRSPDTMPPPGKGDRLTEDEVAMVRVWLTEGARMRESDPVPGSEPPSPETAMETPPLLSWTNQDGRTIQARFGGLDDTHVTLISPDGKSYRYPLEKLSEASQTLAKEQGQTSKS